jgi:hypothetical protein
MDHGARVLILPDESLGKKVEGSFGRNEEHGAGVFTGGDAGTAADTGGRVSGGIGIWFGMTAYIA